MLDELAEFVDLALADERGPMDARQVLSQPSDGVRASGIGQEFELVEAIAEFGRSRSGRLHADEDGSLTGAGSRLRQKARCGVVRVNAQTERTVRRARES